MAYRHPSKQEKEAYVKQLFDEIAEEYDAMNQVISAGQWQKWHMLFAGFTGLRPGMKALDVACGTGDLSLLTAAQVAPGGTVTGVDISEGMLAVGRRRVAGSPYASLITLEQGNAMALPYPDNSFDCVTMGWAMRNVPDIPTVLAEMFRVLKPGGRVVSMDAARPGSALARFGHAVWWKLFVPVIDWAVIKVRQNAKVRPYKYLSASLDNHPSPKALEELFGQAGFVQTGHELIMLGSGSIHYGVKPE